MLNFYNYYEKIHPELIKKLRDLEEKSSVNDNVLVIRPLSTKDTTQSFNSAYAEGKTVYYDDSEFGEDVTLDSIVEIEISEELAYHIVNNVDKIIFYFTGGTRYEGLIYEKRRITRNVARSVFYHISYDPLSSKHNVPDTSTIICENCGSDEGPHYIISTEGKAS